MSEITEAERLANKILDRSHADPDDNLAILSRQFLRAREALEYVNKCLDRSVELQSHYARLLNAHDGGKRMTFLNGDAWMTRLRYLDNAKIAPCDDAEFGMSP